MAATYKGMNDVVAWGDKDTRGAYKPGTVIKVAGRSVKLDEVPDYLAGEKRRGKHLHKH